MACGAWGTPGVRCEVGGSEGCAVLLLCCCCCRVNARCRLTASRPVRTAGRSPRPADERRRSPRSDSQAGAVAPPGGRRPCAPEAIAKRLVPSVVGVAVSVSGVDIQQLARGKAKSARRSGGALARRASHGQIVPPQRHRRDRHRHSHKQPHGEAAQPKPRRLGHEKTQCRNFPSF